MNNEKLNDMVKELLTDDTKYRLSGHVYAREFEPTIEEIKGLMRQAYLKGRRDLEQEAAEIASEIIKNLEVVI